MRLHKCLDDSSGLRAFIVIDDTTLGPAAGGVRTRRYSSESAAIQEARQLARAMTLKCSLAGLDAGGGKAVVMEHERLDRPRAFRILGERIEALGGEFRTAGDLGTTAQDLVAMASRTRYVHTNEGDLAAAVARGLLRCLEACSMREGGESVGGLRIAVQGCGAIGEACARALVEAGAQLLLADVDETRARILASGIGAEVCRADEILYQDVDILAPCAVGGVLSESVAEAVRAWAVCGAANNILAEPSADEVLLRRKILHVPDVIASAGAVIDGIGESIMKLSDRKPLIDRLGVTAGQVLDESRRTGVPSSLVAEKLARRRIAEAGRRT